MSYSSSVTSNQSSTLSAFVRRRMMGEVAIFGGDMRVGVAEFGGAIMGTAHVQLTRALQNITDSLGRLESKARVAEALPSVGLQYEDVERPQQLVRVAKAHQAVATVDMEKVESLITSEIVVQDDLDTYRVFLRLLDKSTKPSAITKPTIKVPEMKSAVLDDQVLALTRHNEPQLSALCRTLSLESDDARMCMRRAIVHTSATGLPVNVALASLGNSAITHRIRSVAISQGKTVAEATSMLHRVLSKDVMCAKGLEAGLQQIVVTGPNVRVDTRNVLGTAMFAIAGACYYVNGEQGIAKYEETFGLSCDVK